MTEQARDLDIRKWYVMAAYKLEIKTEKCLAEAGLEVFLPKQTVYVKQPHRRPKPVERPAIPSLIFVNATRQQLLDFKRRYDDRIKFQMTPAGGSMDYLTVPERQMTDFITLWSSRNDFNATISTAPIASGAQVRIISGPMEGQTGVFIRHLRPRPDAPSVPLSRISLRLANLLSITLDLPTASLLPLP